MENSSSLGAPRDMRLAEEIYPAPKFGVYLNTQLWTVPIPANGT